VRLRVLRSNGHSAAKKTRFGSDNLYYPLPCTEDLLGLCILFNKTVHQLFIDFNKTSDSVRSEVLYMYNILIEFGVAMELVRLIKMCLNETYSKFHTGKHFSETFHTQNGVKHRDALPPLLFNFAHNMPLARHKKIRWD
jgi:hypothetical protein